MTALRLRLGAGASSASPSLAFVVTLLQRGRLLPDRRAHPGRARRLRAVDAAARGAVHGAAAAARCGPDTVGGYVQCRAYGALAILFAIWALPSASGAARGDEERGLVEAVLATGVSRGDAGRGAVPGLRGRGFVVAASAAALGLHRRASTGAQDVDRPGPVARRDASCSAALALSCYCADAAGRASSSPARFATAASGIVLLALFLLNSLSRTIDALRPWRWLSPFHYYDLSQPLPPGGSVRRARHRGALRHRRGDGGGRGPGLRVPRPRARRCSAGTGSSAAADHVTSAGIAPAGACRSCAALYDRRVGLLVWTLGCRGARASCSWSSPRRSSSRCSALAALHAVLQRRSSTAASIRRFSASSGSASRQLLFAGYRHHAGGALVGRGRATAGSS